MNRTFLRFPRRSLLVWGALTLAGSLPAVDVTTIRSTTAGTPSGDWPDALIWSNGVPNNIAGTDWIATIPAGAPTTNLNDSFAVKRFNLSGSVLAASSASNQLLVVDLLDIDSSNLTGPGRLETQGTGTLRGTLNNVRLMSGFTLENSGILDVEVLVLSDAGSRFSNGTDGVVNITKSGSSVGPGIGGPQTNAGTYNVQNTSAFAMDLENLTNTSTGFVNVLAGTGTVRFLQATSLDGDFNIATTAVAEFTNSLAATVAFTPGATVNGEAGSTIRFSGAGKFSIPAAFTTAGFVDVSALEADWTVKPAQMYDLRSLGFGATAKFSGSLPDLHNLTIGGSGTVTGTGDHAISNQLEVGGGGGTLGGTARPHLRAAPPPPVQVSSFPSADSPYPPRWPTRSTPRRSPTAVRCTTSAR